MVWGLRESPGLVSNYWILSGSLAAAVVSTAPANAQPSSQSSAQVLTLLIVLAGVLNKKVEDFRSFLLTALKSFVNLPLRLINQNN